VKIHGYNEVGKVSDAEMRILGSGQDRSDFETDGAAVAA
jgi:hypothetical protein